VGEGFESTRERKYQRRVTRERGAAISARRQGRRRHPPGGKGRKGGVAKKRKGKWGESSEKKDVSAAGD